MRITIETPNLIGHVLKEDHEAGQTPTFEGRTAICGAKVYGLVENRRWVCGKCVAALIADRNAVNRQLDRQRHFLVLAYARIDALEAEAESEKDEEDAEDDSDVLTDGPEDSDFFLTDDPDDE